MTMASPFDDSGPSPRNSHFLLDPPRDSSTSSDPPSDDGDTASQRSISLSSPARSPNRLSEVEVSASSDYIVTEGDVSQEAEAEPSDGPMSLIRKSLSPRMSITPGQTDASSEVDVDGDDRSFFARHLEEGESPPSSVAPSVIERDKETKALRSPPPLPPRPSSQPSSTASPGVRSRSDVQSVASFASGSTSYSKKARPESLVVEPSKSPLILGIALVDFNHLVSKCRHSVA